MGPFRACTASGRGQRQSLGMDLLSEVRAILHGGVTVANSGGEMGGEPEAALVRVMPTKAALVRVMRTQAAQLRALTANVVLQQRSFPGRGMRLDRSALAALGEAVALHSRGTGGRLPLLEVDLGENFDELTAARAMEALGAWLGKTSVQSLLLDGNGVSAAGLRSLAMMPKDLVHLDLSSNPLGDEGISALVKALGRDSRLKDLYLSGCHVGDHGAGELATALTGSLQALSILCLSNNKIANAGAKEIGAALKRSGRKLEKLLLNDNALEEAGALAILDCASEVDVTGNHIFFGNHIFRRGLEPKQVSILNDAGADKDQLMVPSNVSACALAYEMSHEDLGKAKEVVDKFCGSGTWDQFMNAGYTGSVKSKPATPATPASPASPSPANAASPSTPAAPNLASGSGGELVATPDIVLPPVLPDNEGSKPVAVAGGTPFETVKKGRPNHGICECTGCDKHGPDPCTKNFSRSVGYCIECNELQACMVCGAERGPIHGLLGRRYVRKSCSSCSAQRGKRSLHKDRHTKEGNASTEENESEGEDGDASPMPMSPGGLSFPLAMDVDR
jgi:hypothetical protein